MTPAPFPPDLPLSIATVALAFSILFHAITRPRKEHTMTYPEISAALSDLEAAVAAVPARVATMIAAGDPAAAADKADTITDVQSRVGAAVTALNSIGA